MARTRQIEITGADFGASYSIVVHEFGPAEAEEVCYIQASLHADELPGMLCVHHLVRMLDVAETNGWLKKRVQIVPFANPIGLSQVMLGRHVGRFNFQSGVNFNRSYVDMTADILREKTVEMHLKDDDSKHNTKIIREAILQGLEERKSIPHIKTEEALKLELLSMAATSDIVLDLHCDSDAVLHMYTHTRIWPHMQDLAEELQVHCTLLAELSGGEPIDEVCSAPWAALADAYPACRDAIPMACESVTVELRGDRDVSDELAIKDAKALFRFLQRRDYIESLEGIREIQFVCENSKGLGLAFVDFEDAIGCISSWSHSYESLSLENPNHPNRPPALLRDASPLTGMDLIPAERGGIIVWEKMVKPGDVVVKGQRLGEIVDIVVRVFIFCALIFCVLIFCVIIFCVTYV